MVVVSETLYCKKTIITLALEEQLENERTTKGCQRVHDNLGEIRGPKNKEISRKIREKREQEKKKRKKEKKEAHLLFTGKIHDNLSPNSSRGHVIEVPFFLR